jgi:hypothetical protein
MDMRRGENETVQYSRQGTVLYVSHFDEQSTDQIILPKQVFGYWFGDTA